MFKVGDKVVFGRENGEKTLGTVVKVNAKSVTIRQDEERGASRVREVGTRWRAHTPEMKAFVSTYGLYNPGRLIGRWFDAFELDDEDAVMDELRAVVAAPIDQSELVRAKDNVKGSLILGLESTRQRAAYLANPVPSALTIASLAANRLA